MSRSLGPRVTALQVRRGRFTLRLAAGGREALARLALNVPARHALLCSDGGACRPLSFLIISIPMCHAQMEPEPHSTHHPTPPPPTNPTDDSEAFKQAIKKASSAAKLAWLKVCCCTLATQQWKHRVGR